LRDLNDNGPQFTQKQYRVELAENSPDGTRVITVQATDKDTEQDFGTVYYSSLIGTHGAAFRLDPITGDIFVDNSQLLDREIVPGLQIYMAH